MRTSLRGLVGLVAAMVVGATVVLGAGPASAVTRPTATSLATVIDCGSLHQGYYTAMRVTAQFTNLTPGLTYDLHFRAVSMNSELLDDVPFVADGQGTSSVDQTLTDRFIASAQYTATLMQGATSFGSRFYTSNACASAVNAVGTPTARYVCDTRYLTPGGVSATSVRVAGTLTGFVPGEPYSVWMPGAGANVNATADANGAIAFDTTVDKSSLAPLTSSTYSIGTTSQGIAVGSGQLPFADDCPSIAKAAKRTALTHDGDLTGDGYADLLAVDATGQLWMYANGVKTNPSHVPFSTGRVIGSGWLNNGPIQWTAEGDLTGDGYADVVAVTSTGALWAYYNNIGSNPGRVPFTSPTVIGSGWLPFLRVAVGDVNGDGYADIIAGTQDGANYLYLNHYATDPLHRPFSSGVRLTGEDFPSWGAVGAGDFNGDGYADLTVEGGSVDPNRTPAGASTPFVRSVSLAQDHGVPTTGSRLDWSIGDYEGRGSVGVVYADIWGTGKLIYNKDPLGSGQETQIGSGWQTMQFLIQ